MSEQYADGADAESIDPAETTDEDNLGADPLEDGMDTAEGYSRDMRQGGIRESAEQDTLAYRFPQEEPDPALEEIDTEPGRPLAATPIDDLDESVDAPEHAVDGVGGGTVLDPPGGDGRTEAEELAEDGIDGAEQQALRVEQER